MPSWNFGMDHILWLVVICMSEYLTKSSVIHEPLLKSPLYCICTIYTTVPFVTFDTGLHDNVIVEKVAFTTSGIPGRFILTPSPWSMSAGSALKKLHVVLQMWLFWRNKHLSLGVLAPDTSMPTDSYTVYMLHDIYFIYQSFNFCVKLKHTSAKERL